MRIAQRHGDHEDLAVGVSFDYTSGADQIIQQIHVGVIRKPGNGFFIRVFSIFNQYLVVFM